MVNGEDIRSACGLARVRYDKYNGFSKTLNNKPYMVFYRGEALLSFEHLDQAVQWLEQNKRVIFN